SLHDRGLAASSVARKTAAVRGLHRFRVTEGLAEDDPTVLMETAKRSQPLPKALTLDEVMALLDTPDTATPAGRRDRAILEFLYATGARVSEVVGLDQEDIDLEAGTAIVTGKGNKQRLVPLGGFAVRAIEAYLPDRLGIRLSGRDPGALFLNARGGRLTRQGLWGIVRKQAARAGIPADRVSPHVLRHSAATHMVERGADLRSVQQLLGHATITTTQVYTRVTPQHLFEVYVTSHPRSR
ncbi:MAG: tyrosine recombinase, partial [Acidimicrobiia bacterium]|nr:tyrosine recombinase [Acidimicrobiia bacterium]